MEHGTSYQSIIPDEHFEQPIPPGFKILASMETRGIKSREVVPETENENNWTRMITTQSFPVPPNVTSATFLRSFGDEYLQACPDGEHTNIVNGNSGPFPSSALALKCGSVPGRAQAEAVYLKAVRGRSHIYVVQVAFHRPPDIADVEFARRYLDLAKVRAR